MAPSNVGAALGAMSEVFGKHFADQKQQEHDDEQNRIKLVSGLVSAGLQSGTVSNPNEAFQFLLDQVGGKGKGGKKGELPGPLKMILGATQQASGPTATAGGQPLPTFQQPTQAPANGMPQFLSGQQLTQQAEDAKIREAKRMNTEVTLPEKTAENALLMERDKARLGSIDKATQARAMQMAAQAGDDDNWNAYIQPAAQALASERTAKTNIPKTAEEKRGSELAGAAGKSWNDLSDMERRAYVAAGSKQIAAERTQKQRDASSRLGAYLSASRQSLLTNTERYSEMKDLFPHVLAAKIAGEEIADLKPELVRQALERGSVNLALSDERLQQMKDRGATDQEIREERLKALKAKAASGDAKTDTAAQREAAKIVEQATKLASSKAAKQSAIAMGLGIDDDEATIRRAYIQELSGGQDPAAVEALAQKASAAAPVAPPKATPASANPFR